MLNKEQLVEAITRGDGVNKIARSAGCSATNVKYWARKWDISFINKPFNKREIGRPSCKCGENDPEKFYGHKKTVCGSCHLKDVSERGHKNRDRIVQHLGGRCRACGYDKYPCALDAHHLDPTIKDSTFASKRGWSWKRIEKELQGCVLLCKNCHAAHHSGAAVFSLRGVA